MQTTLKEIQPGKKGKVVRVDGSGAFRRRLLDMGITPGTEILVQKTAPLGDPVEVKLRGYGLSLRKADANAIWMDIA